MRRFTLGLVLSVAVLLPNVGTAQVFLRPTPYPATTAASSTWLHRGDPVFHAGAFYFPTGPTVFFDGNVMARTGTYEGVPLYEDATLSPYTIVYVPIGGNVVRPYERRREGELAGTVGSRPPSFPIRRAEVSVEAGAPGNMGIFTPAVEGFAPVMPQAPRSLSTAGSMVAPAFPRPNAPSTSRIDKRAVPSVLQVWVPYEAARWFSAGSAVPYAADRFVQVGEYGGFPVYRDRTGSEDQIYIPSVAGGPVAPYKKNK